MGCCSSSSSADKVAHKKPNGKLHVSYLPMPPHGPSVVSRTTSFVYDGDTLTLDDGERVRLLCIDTPELRPEEPYAVEARDYCRWLCPTGGEILLELPEEGQRRDKHGRLVALVFAPHPTMRGYVCVNAALLEMGLANIYIPRGAAGLRREMLVAAQKDARRARRNIWKDVDESLVVLVTTSGIAFHRVGGPCSSATRQKRLGEALDMLLSPCRICKPLALTSGLGGGGGN